MSVCKRLFNRMIKETTECVKRNIPLRYTDWLKRRLKETHKAHGEEV